jgi:hypothetical protein
VMSRCLPSHLDIGRYANGIFWMRQYRCYCRPIAGWEFDNKSLIMQLHDQVVRATSTHKEPFEATFEVYHENVIS